MSISRKRALASATIAAILCTSAGGCSSTSDGKPPSSPPAQSARHGPPPWAPAHGYRRKFTYAHYPSCNVYFDRERKLWFWIEGRDWKIGVELPSRIRIDESEGVTIELDTDTPYASGSSSKGRGKGKKG